MCPVCGTQHSHTMPRSPALPQPPLPPTPVSSGNGRASSGSPCRGVTVKCERAHTESPVLQHGRLDPEGLILTFREPGKSEKDPTGCLHLPAHCVFSCTLPLPYTPSFSQLSLSRPCLFSEVFSKGHLLHEALPGPREAESLSLSPQRRPRPTVYYCSFPTLLKAPPSQLVCAGLRVPAGRTRVSHTGRQQQVSVDPRTQPQEPDLAFTLG